MGSLPLFYNKIHDCDEKKFSDEITVSLKELKKVLWPVNAN